LDFSGRKKKKREGDKGLIADEGRLTKDEVRVHRRLDQLLFGKRKSVRMREDLEEVLFTSDLGVAHNQELIRLVQEGVGEKRVGSTRETRLP